MRKLMIFIFLVQFANAEESPIFDKGTENDRQTGTQYVYRVHKNGTIHLIGQDPRTADYFEISISLDGTMITKGRGEWWTYHADSDACESTKGNYMRGMPCIHPIVKHFLLKHEFDPPHPLYSRVTEI